MVTGLLTRKKTRRSKKGLPNSGRIRARIAWLSYIRIILPRGAEGAGVGVINEYFLASSDAAAADVLDTGPTNAVIGPDPGSELASLEAILLGLDPVSDEAVSLVSRDDHAVDVAHHDDYSCMVVKIASGTTQLIASATLDELRPHLQRWARTEDFAGTTDADLHEMMTALHPLFVSAASDPGQALYVWISL
ncbi:hypothetical protein A7R75_07095 [Mycolicibacterium llatzerense]|nr:hypothetical protein [Mycolicibacterium llatzerense]